MLSRRARRLLLTVGLMGAVVPAVAQGPTSLLPPGFGDPKTNAPPATPKAPPPAPTPPAATPTSPTGPATPPGAATPPAETAAQPVRPQQTEDSALTDLQALPLPPQPRFYDLPPGQARPTDIVGVLGTDNRGLAIDAFGGDAGNGVYLATMMHELRAPLPSRWASILLRRALISRVLAPGGINPVDFVAERVRLLVRMGEADAARMLTQSIDVDTYTPGMVDAAYQASLASADPAGLCPLVQKGRALSDDPAWPMADAMCAAMEGEAARASTLLDQARRGGAKGPDLALAEKIVGAGSNSQRSAAIQWDAVPELNLWRFGLASAAGDAVPDRLLTGAGPATQAWMARAPMVPVEQRLAAADMAAVLGVFSSASLVDIQSMVFDAADTKDQASSVGGRLQTAYAGNDAGARVGAMRALWREAGDDPVKHYARLILTAGAAGQLTPSSDLSSDSVNVVSSLLSAGMDREAAAWAGVVEGAGDDLAATLIAIGAARPASAIDSSRVEGLGGAKARMAAAGLAGLGRLNATAARNIGVDIGRENAWTRALDQAAASGQQATVALLVAVGLQAPDWQSVPADHLYRIVRALHQVGLDFEARMIAAEALMRA